MIRRSAPWRGWLTALACAVGVVGATGCGGGKKGRIWITHYPAFYQPELKRVAVLPFGNRTQDPAAGQRISDKVSALLTNNGTYEVYTRAHLADVLGEKDLAAAGIIDADAAMRIGKLKSVQALICGVCNRYDAETKQETRYRLEPIWGYNRKGEQVITGWKQVPYPWTIHQVYVECQVVVIDTLTGEQVAAVHQPSTAKAEGNPPRHTPAELLRAAEEDQVRRIVFAVAVTRRQIKLEGDPVRTAAALYDNEWDWEDKFVPSDEKAVAVVRLPAEADRNNFKLTVIPKEERKVLWEHAFVWDKANRTQGFEVPLGPIVAARGLGEYQVKLYSGPEPIAWHTFRIVEKR
jgi:hypothetical protein